jgi:hypothetical protein
LLINIFNLKICGHIPWGWLNLLETEEQLKTNLSLTIFAAIIPFDEIILALGEL